MKKARNLAILILGLATLTFAQERPRPRFELELSGGLARVASLRGGARYSDRWGYKFLEYVQEDTVISLKAKNSPFALAGLTFDLGETVGIQVGAAYMMPRIATNGTFYYSYKWTTGTTVYNESAANSNVPWSGSGKASSLPFFLNVVWRFPLGIFDFFATAGPAVFFNRFEASSFVGLGDTTYYSVIIWPYLYEYQFTDAFKIPARIPRTSWTSFGGDFGAGFDLRLTPAFGLTVEGRYFLAPPKSFSWQWTPGTYDSIFYGTFQGWQYAVNDLKDFQAKMGASRINVSFFSVAVGFRIGFGLI
jgi:hypothetical protein